MAASIDTTLEESEKTEDKAERLAILEKAADYEKLALEQISASESSFQISLPFFALKQ